MKHAQQFYIVTTIVAIVTLSLFIVFFVPFINSNQYVSDQNACAQTFQLISSRDNVFDAHGNLKDQYRSLLEASCPINYRTIPLQSHITSCWNQGGEGYIVFKNIEGTLCMLCGEYRDDNIGTTLRELDIDDEFIVGQIQENGINANTLYYTNKQSKSKDIYISLLEDYKEFYVIFFHKQVEKEVKTWKEQMIAVIPGATIITDFFEAIENQPNELAYIAGVVLIPKEQYEDIAFRERTFGCQDLFLPKNIYEN